MSGVYVLAGQRTPIGSFLGGLASVSAIELGGTAIRAALDVAGLIGDQVDEVYMGQVLSAGVGQAPARQASLAAKIPVGVPTTTLNKVCGSGLQALIMGSRQIALGEADLVVVGGMENMSQAPHLLKGSRGGYRYGNSELTDSLQMDGLWDPYANSAMGNLAEACVKKYNLSREMQDEFAIESYRRAQSAVKSGSFKDEIVPVVIKGRQGEVRVDTDEGPFQVKFDKVKSLRAAFEREGTITAANASSINDGAAALVLAGEEYRDRAVFRLVAYAAHAHDPAFFTTAPIYAMKKCLKKGLLSVSDIDLFEINEAFSAVTLAAMTDLELDSEKVNVFGGAVSLGHPIGCSGARIVVTLMNALTQRGGRYGMAALCIGGGEGLALIIERLARR